MERGTLSCDVCTVNTTLKPIAPRLRLVVQRLHFSCIYFSRRTETWERERSNSDRRELIAGALVKSDNCARLIGNTYEVLWNTESWILLILLQLSSFFFTPHHILSMLGSSWVVVATMLCLH